MCEPSPLLPWGMRCVLLFYGTPKRLDETCGCLVISRPTMFLCEKLTGISRRLLAECRRPRLATK